MIGARTLDDLLDKVMDSRDLVDALKECESELEGLGPNADSDPDTAADADELRQAIDALTDAIEAVEDGSGESAKDGVTIIRDDDFEDYARELAEDIGAIQSDAGWPMDYIDWERAADALKMDYSSITLGGYEYWVRA